ncbi:hypothetical protein BAE44_0005076 [Dichanthelium oligosanthes]|uniref:MADS-box domain-containing protein n=1 Tax=Dichanthelium oligosanthes TaxID=888268 RepID=A0A1E5W955_9POAL|nr:hypothetical protein BAE44_0005076 [Dichanthelium oligosanthes]
MKSIECPEARCMCFSECRQDLFEEAIELCELTGAHVAVVVFSPAGNPYSFATPPRRRDALDAAAREGGAWRTGDDMRRAGLPDLVPMLDALERARDEAAERAREIIVAEEAMTQQCAAAGASTFTADDGGAAGSSHQEGMDTQMMLIMGGGDVSHAAPAPLPFAPMMTLPPDLPPQPPFNYGAGHNHIAGYDGYGLDLGDGGSNGDAYEMEGYYYGTTTTCNFFG